MRIRDRALIPGFRTPKTGAANPKFGTGPEFDLPNALVDPPLVFLKDMRRRQQELVELVKRIVEIKRPAYDPKGGRTIGLVVPDDIRERLELMKAAHHVRSYRHTVLVAVRLGLVELERAQTSPAVESLRSERQHPDRSVLDDEFDFESLRPHPVLVQIPWESSGDPDEELSEEAITELEGWEIDELDEPKELPDEELDPEKFTFGGPGTFRD